MISDPDRVLPCHRIASHFPARNCNAGARSQEVCLPSQTDVAGLLAAITPSPLGDGDSSPLETGAVSPRIIARARRAWPVAGGAFVGSSTRGPAIDDACALRRFMAAGAASGAGRADDGEAAGERHYKEQIPHDCLHDWRSRMPRDPAIRSPTTDFASSISIRWRSRSSAGHIAVNDDSKNIDERVHEPVFRFDHGKMTDRGRAVRWRRWSALRPGRLP